MSLATLTDDQISSLLGVPKKVENPGSRQRTEGKQAESFAQATGQYNTLEGAIHELTRLANIRGLETRPDERNFFAQ